MMKKKQPKMTRKRPNVLADKNHNIYNEEGVFGEPLSLRAMKEMDVMPLEDNTYIDNSEYEILPTGKLRKKIAQGDDGENLFHKTAGKGCRDDFVLFRKQLQPTLLDPFSKVSAEIILHIFQWLPKPTLVKCSSVCTRWRDLSYDESLWRRYDFGRRVVKPCVLEILLKRGVTILRLAMSEIKSPSFSGEYLNHMSNPPSYCSLRYLDLSMATVSVSGLADLLSVCCHLRKLSVENCVLNEDCCRNIAQNSELTVLNMVMCSGLTSAGLCAISVKCKKLVEWNLAWVNLADGCLEEFLPYMPISLKRLNLSGNRDTLNDNALIEVLNRCIDLIELDISDCTLLTNVAFEVLVSNCSKLQHLHTSRSYNIPTDSNRLLKNMKHLRNLEIFRTLNDEALSSLREYMPDVQINQHVFSTIARPTTGIRRTSIWGLRVRD